MTAFVFSADRALMAQFATAHKALADRNTGRMVTVLVGKYAGRKAKITGVTVDLEKGEWLFCCMVLRANGSGYLNSDAQSRAYRPTWEFHKVEE